MILVGGWHKVCSLFRELSPMSHVQQHQRSQQARTSLTKAGQHIGYVRMPQCAANWLKQDTGSGCLA